MTLAAVLMIAGCGMRGAESGPSLGKRAEQVEPLLSAAGFQMVRADTPEKMKQLRTLPQLRLRYYVTKAGRLLYWSADPEFCRCVYLGDEQAYQRYEQLRFQAQWSAAYRLPGSSTESFEANESRQMRLPSGLIGPQATMPEASPVYS